MNKTMHQSFKSDGIQTKPLPPLCDFVKNISPRFAEAVN